MLGSSVDNKDFHFAGAARRFALDAKMFRCRAAVHVENKDDIVFWSAVLKHFRPNERFHFIAGSRNEFGHETSGVTQCLKYYDFLSHDFFICIDSDYRYLLRDRGIDARHCVLQTYTYSFENHRCFADGLNDVCGRVTHLENYVFDFNKFLKEYSCALYELFIWHLYFLGANPMIFTKFDFNKYLNQVGCRPNSLVRDNGMQAIREFRQRVEKRVDSFAKRYPGADLDTVKLRCKELGLVPESTYLFLRGHNVYDMISCLCKDVCKVLLEREKNNRKKNRETIASLFHNRNNLDLQLKQNIRYDAYSAIRKIGDDIKSFLG